MPIKINRVIEAIGHICTDYWLAAIMMLLRKLVDTRAWVAPNKLTVLLGYL